MVRFIATHKNVKGGKKQQERRRKKLCSFSKIKSAGNWEEQIKSYNMSCKSLLYMLICDELSPCLLNGETIRESKRAAFSGKYPTASLK